MRTMILAAFVVAAAATHEAQAAYTLGYSDTAGYTLLDDGLWWKDGVAYNRIAKREYYTHCGRRYYRTVYRYERAAVKTYAKINPEKDPDWRIKLLEIVKDRDAWEGEIRRSANEHNEFLESIKALGLEGNFVWDGYGYEPRFAQGAAQQQPLQYSQPTAPQGATLYGYRELADVYGNVDLGALYNDAIRLRSQSYQNESKATSETHALIDNLSNRVAAIEEIRAKGAAAAEALKAAEAKDRATILRELWGSERPPTAKERPAGAGHAALLQVVSARCAGCHSADAKAGGLDLTNPVGLPDAAKWAILKRVVHTDPAKRMPLGQGNEPGQPLPVDELAVLFGTLTVVED